MRTIPVMLDYPHHRRVAPNALLDYSNPMAMLTGAILKATGVRTVGLCHSVRCAPPACAANSTSQTTTCSGALPKCQPSGWLLEISRCGGTSTEIKRRAERPEYKAKDAVRFELMKWFGYYVTYSSEHCAEYVPWFIKRSAPELIDRFHIPLDEYPRRCIRQIERWDAMKADLLADKPLHHARGHEYASYILDAVLTGTPYTFGGNVLNEGLITNLPAGCCVEVMCVADRNGITPTYVGDLPVQCAALTRTNVNVHELTIEAALTRKKDAIYQAALLDPHTAAELTIDQIVSLCDELIAAHGEYLPTYH